MKKDQGIRIDRAKTALDLACAYHAGATLAAQDKPDDPEAQRRAGASTQKGKDAWKDYLLLATPELAAQHECLVPSVFLED